MDVTSTTAATKNQAAGYPVVFSTSLNFPTVASNDERQLFRENSTETKLQERILWQTIKIERALNLLAWVALQSAEAQRHPKSHSCDSPYVAALVYFSMKVSTFFVYSSTWLVMIAGRGALGGCSDGPRVLLLAVQRTNAFSILSRPSGCLQDPVLVGSKVLSTPHRTQHSHVL